jgi:hypothetical protein
MSRYYVASPGSVITNGWAVRLRAGVAKRFAASIDYALSRATWVSGSEADAISLVMPSIVRPARERLHDLTTSIDASIPETSTRVALIYRVSNGFSRAGIDGGAGLNARFDVQIHQALPFQPIHGSRWEVMVAVRNLFRDLRQAGSAYDELLTVAPPTRFVGGLQVRF